MKYEIWHQKNPTFFTTGVCSKVDFPDGFEKVAIVEAKDEEHVFELTNHINSDWTKNPEVVQLFKPQCRSTSVGDVIVDEDGYKVLCAPIGWKDLGKD